MSVLSLLKWRYATKRMNGQKVPDEKLGTILEAVRLAPSSLGLQPYTVFVVESEAWRKKVSPAIYNQPQILEGSHVLVFAAWGNITRESIDNYLDNVAKARNIPASSLEGYRSMIEGSIAGKTPEQIRAWNAKQAYIALGVGLIAAAEEGVDATPMEGFDPAALDAALGLDKLDLHSAVVLALGYRDAANDHLASAPKVRRNISELVVRL